MTLSILDDERFSVRRKVGGVHEAFALSRRDGSEEIVGHDDYHLDYHFLFEERVHDGDEVVVSPVVLAAEHAVLEVETREDGQIVFDVLFVATGQIDPAGDAEDCVAMKSADRVCGEERARAHTSEKYKWESLHLMVMLW
jgi:hypothetical protein